MIIVFIMQTNTHTKRTGLLKTQISKEYAGKEIAIAQLLFGSIKKSKPKPDGMEVLNGSAAGTYKFAETSKTKGCKRQQLDCIIKMALLE